MADVPISDALIASVQFQVQGSVPATPASGNVRLYRDAEGWKSKQSDGTVDRVGGGLVTHVAEVSVTSAQLKALTTTPKLLIPGVVGKLTVPFFVYVTQHFGTVAYTASPYSSTVFGYQTAPGTLQLLTSSSGLSLDDEVRTTVFYGWVRLSNTNPTDVVGKDVVLINNGAELENGDGTVDLMFLYYLI